MMEPGRMLGERYRLTRHIASGGMGDVWEAEDTVLERPVALKILRAEHAADPDFVERFRAEARHAAGLSDPRITAVHDYGEAQDNGTTVAYLVMELVPGEPLSATLARDGKLSVDRTLAVVADTADALQTAHDAGVVHRDVKPGNILIRPDGSVSITDFGIARATNEPNHLTRTGLVVGTAYYLPPEQAAGKQVTPASDLYALGVVAYECLSGRKPFSGDNAVHVAVAHLRDDPPPLGDDVPEPVQQLVGSLMAKDPLARPAHAADVAAAARALRTDPDDATGVAATALLPSLADAATAPVDLSETHVDAAVADRPRWRKDAYPNQRRTRSLLLLAGLIVVVIGALLLVLVGNGHGHSSAQAKTSPTPRPSPTASATPAGVTVSAASYIGRKYDAVKADLAALGLAVRRRTASSTRTPDTVIAVTPTGQVPARSTITVTVATAPPPPHPPKPKHHGPGKKDQK
jgi:serine/threonine protein kinase